MDRRRSLHIVPEIYEATIDPDHWDYVITMIAKLTQSRPSCLYYKYKYKDMETTSIVAQYGLPNTEQLNVRDQYDSLDSMICVGRTTVREN